MAAVTMSCSTPRPQQIQVPHITLGNRISLLRCLCLYHRQLQETSASSDRLWVLASVIFYGYQTFSAFVKWLKRQADLSSPSSAKVKNEWSCISTPSHAFMLCRTTYATYISVPWCVCYSFSKSNISVRPTVIMREISYISGVGVLLLVYIWHICRFKIQHFRKAYSDNERNQLYLRCRRCTSTCIYMAYLSFQKPTLRMLPYCPERTNLHCPNYRFSPLRHCQFTDATSCGLQFISFALHYCTIILLLWTLMWHVNWNVEDLGFHTKQFNWKF